MSGFRGFAGIVILGVALTGFGAVSALGESNLGAISPVTATLPTPPPVPPVPVPKLPTPPPVPPPPVPPVPAPKLPAPPPVPPVPAPKPPTQPPARVAPPPPPAVRGTTPVARATTRAQGTLSGVASAHPVAGPANSTAQSAASGRGGTPPPPTTPPSAPPDPGGGITLSVPQSANEHVFAAFISFILFGGAPGLGLTPLQQLPFGATGTAVAKKTGFHRTGSSALASKTGTLGASKALTAKTPAGGSTLWWVYVVVAALATLVLVLVARALSRRRLRAA